MNPNPPKKRQAVVLIHGIGEQYPITTLREFVESVAQILKIKRQARPDEVIFWEKPDPESGNFETRKMTMRQGRKHPTTDFYEFYWAHHMRDTNFSHISDWLSRVVFRLPHAISPRLLPVFIFFWLLIALLVTIFMVNVTRLGWDSTLSRITSVGSGIFITFLLGFLSKFLFNYLGDAARYLDPSPKNIGERKNIRTEGINLLKKLHESGRYNRIILVGHSLGSVIAYDLVKFLWNEYNTSFDAGKFYETYSGSKKWVLNDVSRAEEASKNMAVGEAGIRDFRLAQDKSFDYLQSIGNKWLITDLVTIGSPLAHAGHLFVYKKGLFEKLKNQREYPTCPPHFQKPDTTNIIRSDFFTIPGVSHPFIIKHFNHSSPFAVTKWTNIYYSCDYIGGPLNPLFGAGIKDIEIKKSNYFPIVPAGHTQYWNWKNARHILNDLWKILESR